MPKINGAQCLADMLAGYGVTHVFMVPAVLRRTFAEMERRTKIKRIHTHGENPPPTWPTATRALRAGGICMAQVIALSTSPRVCATRTSRIRPYRITGGRDAKTKFRKVYRRWTTCRRSSR